MSDDKNLKSKFRQKMVALGFRYTENPVVGSSSPDLMVTSPSGTSAIVEAKYWAPSSSSVGRASELAHLYRARSGIRNSFILLPDLPSGVIPYNVISPTRLEPLVAALSKKPSRNASKPNIKRTPRPRAIAFVAMPFTRRFDKPYEFAVKPACTSGGLTCVRVDKQHYAGDVVAKIKKSIRTSQLVIADVTTSNPNVLFEIGYAHARGLPVIQISAASLKKLPFDIRNDNTAQYKPSSLPRLRRHLDKTIKNTYRRKPSARG